MRGDWLYRLGMKFVAKFAVCGLVVCLSGCGGSANPVATEPTASSSSAQASSLASSGSGSAPHVRYETYIDGVLSRDKRSVLFFQQPADPFSQRSDHILRQAYASGSAKISTYRLDSGTASGMKLAYGVLLPDTFVVVSATGAKITSILHPNVGELRSLITNTPAH